ACLAFSGVHSDTPLDARPPHSLGDGDAASHRPSRPVERCEEPVTSRAYLASPIARQLRAHDVVMILKYTMPETISDICCLCRRTDDVAEQDCGEHSIRAV